MEKRTGKGSKSKIEKVFLFSSPTESSREKIPEIEEILRKSNLEFVGSKEVFRDEEPKLGESMEADLALALGGDGTILRISREVGETPILGLNTGRIGFLTEVTPGEFEETIEKIQQGDFRIEYFPRLEASIKYPSGKEEELPTVLNEYLITSKRQGKILHLQLSINNNPIAKWRGDGAILASPLGSTAYSLSEGGSVLLPQINAYIFTPLAPIWRKMRPLVIPNGASVKIKLLKRGWEGIVVSDGARENFLPKESEISIRLSERETAFLRTQQLYSRLVKLFTFL